MRIYSGYADDLIASLTNAVTTGLEQTAVRKVEFRSSYSDPHSIDMTTPSSGITAAVLNDIKPAFTFSGTFGSYTFAPYGEPDPDNGLQKLKIGVAAVGVAVGLMFLGRAVLP